MISSDANSLVQSKKGKGNGGGGGGVGGGAGANAIMGGCEFLSFLLSLGFYQ